MKTLALLCMLIVALALGGCAGMRRIDSQVTSFAPQALPAGASYRFERLPSQQADDPAQSQLEAMTERALDAVGLHHADQHATLTVQVSSSRRSQTLYLDGGWGLHHGWAATYPHHFARPLFPGLSTQTLYWRELELVVRDAASRTVLYETRASNDNPWPDDAAILPAMLEAALQGFPTPPPGVRRIPIDIPR